MNDLATIVILQLVRLSNKQLGLYISYEFTTETVRGAYRRILKLDNETPNWYMGVIKFIFGLTAVLCLLLWIISFVFVTGSGMNDIFPILQNFKIFPVGTAVVICLYVLKKKLRVKTKKHVPSTIDETEAKSKTSTTSTTSTKTDGALSSSSNRSPSVSGTSGNDNGGRIEMYDALAMNKLLKMDRKLSLLMLLAAVITLIALYGCFTSVTNLIDNGISNFFDPPFATQNALIDETIGFLSYEICIFVWTYSKYPKHCGFYCATMNQYSILYVTCLVCFFPCHCLAPYFFGDSLFNDDNNDNNDKNNNNKQETQNEKQKITPNRATDLSAISDDVDTTSLALNMNNSIAENKNENEITNVASTFNVENLLDPIVKSTRRLILDKNVSIQAVVYNFENTFLCNCDSLIKLQRLYDESRLLCMKKLQEMGTKQIVELLFDNNQHFDALKLHLMFMNNNKKCLLILLSKKYDTNLICSILHILKLSQFFISNNYQSKLNNFGNSGTMDMYLIQRVYGHEHIMFGMEWNAKTRHDNVIVTCLLAILNITQLIGDELVYIDSHINQSLLQHINAINLCKIYYCQTRNGLTFDDMLCINLIKSYFSHNYNFKQINTYNNNNNNNSIIIAIPNQLNESNTYSNYEYSAEM